MADCGSNGSILNHATAQMNQTLAHQAAFHQRSIGGSPIEPSVEMPSRVHTRTVRGPAGSQTRREGSDMQYPERARASIRQTASLGRPGASEVKSQVRGRRREAHLRHFSGDLTVLHVPLRVLERCVGGSNPSEVRSIECLRLPSAERGSERRAHARQSVNGTS